MHGWRDDIAAARYAQYDAIVESGIPDHGAQIRIYPDAAHGLRFQYPIEVAEEVNAFLVR